LHPDRVYFFEGLEPGGDGERLIENNWIQFRNRLQARITGLEQQVGTVIENLRGAWRDKGTLESKLRVWRQQLDERIGVLCEPDDEQPTGCDFTEAERKAALDRSGPGCDFQHECAEDDARCETLVQTFTAAEANDDACRADARQFKVDDGRRLCVRGRVG